MERNHRSMTTVQSCSRLPSQRRRCAFVRYNQERYGGNTNNRATTGDGPVVTEGSTFEELQENIRDAVALYFEGDDPASLGFERAPSILTSFEVAQPPYAGRA